MVVTVEFLGGPVDGCIKALRFLSPTYIMPICHLAETFTDEESVEVKYLVYQLEHNEFGLPALNDKGLYHYYFEGIR